MCSTCSNWNTRNLGRDCETMKLSTLQVQRFWREWAKACKVNNWPRTEHESRRKELLARCGFQSLTAVDRMAGFTQVLHEVIVHQGVSLKSAQETQNPALNEARVLVNHIASELVPCLELYVQDVKAYLTTIIESKSRYRQTDRPERPLELTDLDAGQLKHVQFTLAARINTLRNKAGHSVHDMRIAALLPCGCAKCFGARVAKEVAAEVAEAETVGSFKPF